MIPEPHPPALPLARGRFVGRRAELARLRERLEQCVAGRGGVVLLIGEAGAGKTRIVQELAHYARLRGVAVAWGVRDATARPAAGPLLAVLDGADAAEVERFLDALPAADRDTTLTVATSRTPSRLESLPALVTIRLERFVHGALPRKQSASAPEGETER